MYKVCIRSLTQVQKQPIGDNRTSKWLSAEAWPEAYGTVFWWRADITKLTPLAPPALRLYPSNNGFHRHSMCSVPIRVFWIPWVINTIIVCLFPTLIYAKRRANHRPGTKKERKKLKWKTGSCQRKTEQIMSVTQPNLNVEWSLCVLHHHDHPPGNESNVYHLDV